jgi:nitroreductase
MDTLLEAFARAPSGDNLQPWRVEVDRARGHLRVFLDEKSDQTLLNPGQRAALMAVGAALHNLERTAAFNRWPVVVEPSQAPTLATLRIGEPDAPAGVVDPLVAFRVIRVTNRRMYDGRPLPAQLQAELAGLPPPGERLRAIWVCERKRVDELARLYRRGDAILFGERAMRRAFLSHLQVGARPAARGLPMRALETSLLERLALRTVRRLPDWIMPAGLAGLPFARHAAALVRSASAVCFLAAPEVDTGDEIALGRAIERTWLALTERGLAVQPMMSLPGLEAAYVLGEPESRARLARAGMARLSEQLRRAVPELAGAHPVFALRIGFAPPPSARAGRTPLGVA